VSGLPATTAPTTAGGLLTPLPDPPWRAQRTVTLTSIRDQLLALDAQIARDLHRVRPYGD
jgi:hypothetical protein